MWSCEGAENWDLSLNHDISPPQLDPDDAFGILNHQNLDNVGRINTPRPLPISETLPQIDLPVSESPDTSSARVEGLALDRDPHRSTQLIGFSNESDPFLLQRWPYNTSDEVDFFMVTYRKANPSTNPPVHFLQSKVDTASQARDLIENCMSMRDTRDELEQLVGIDMGVALLNL